MRHQGESTTIAHRGDGSLAAGAQADSWESFPVFLAALAALGVARIIAVAVNGTDLYMDEAQYWAWSLEPDFGYFSKPPLIAWIIHGATSVCGAGEWCIRLPAVILHLATAIIVFLTGQRLYSTRTGFWAGLAYALLPAVSLSSGIISTDVPLLTAWSLALFAFAGIVQRPNIRDTVLLALAIGLGLNAKYAMAYFVLCAAICFLLVPAFRSRLAAPHLWAGLLAGLVLIAPNVMWNVEHGFVTLAHTADNAKWGGIPFHPGKAAEFVISQFGVFGPVLFGALIVIAWRAIRSTHNVREPDHLLLAFSIPIIAAVTLQALISRAHANWAAPAYIAGVILVTAVMLRDRETAWMRASFAINGAAAVLIALATWQAGKFSLPFSGDPFARTLGNEALAVAVSDELKRAERSGKPFRAIVTDDREYAATLAYYGRNLSVPQFAMRPQAAPRNHFEMASPVTRETPQPMLLVSPRSATPAAADFNFVSAKRTRSIKAGMTTRTVHFSNLAGFRETRQ